MSDTASNQSMKPTAPLRGDFCDLPPTPPVAYLCLVRSHDALAVCNKYPAQRVELPVRRAKDDIRRGRADILRKARYSTRHRPRISGTCWHVHAQSPSTLRLMRSAVPESHLGDTFALSQQCPAYSRSVFILPALRRRVLEVRWGAIRFIMKPNQSMKPTAPDRQC
jgi:hypothetical protein